MQSADLERDQGGALRASVSSVHAGELGNGAGDGDEKEQGATAGPASRAGALVSCGSCDPLKGRGFAQPAPATSRAPDSCARSVASVSPVSVR